MKLLDFNRIGYRLRVAFNIDALILLAIGLALFTMRLPVEPGGWINWPVAETVYQTAGLMFMFFGFMIHISLLMWPQINLSSLMQEVRDGNTAAGIVVAALLLFNAIAVVAFAIWLTGALGAGVVAR